MNVNALKQYREYFPVNDKLEENFKYSYMVSEMFSKEKKLFSSSGNSKSLKPKWK